MNAVYSTYVDYSTGVDMQFVDFLYRIKQSLDLKQDKDVADFLGLSEKAFSARKNRNSIPEQQLRMAAAEHPNLQIDVDYIFRPKQNPRIAWWIKPQSRIFHERNHCPHPRAAEYEP